MISMRSVKKGFFVCFVVVAMGILVNFNSHVGQANGVYWQNGGTGTIENPLGEHVLTSADLMATFDGSTMADTFIWQLAEVDTCPVIASGQFPTGANGIAGAKWYLCEDGDLYVGGGALSNNGWASPWHAYSNNINRIIFTEDIVAQQSLVSIFAHLSYLTEILGLEHFDTNQVIYMSWMFSRANNLSELDLSSWNTGQVTDMSGMFHEATNLTELNLSGWDTSQVTDMRRMFFGTRNLIEIDVSGWDTSQVSDMSGMFGETISLATLDVSGWNTSQVTDMSWMFAGFNSSLSSLDVSGWDTSQVTDMSAMFNGASFLTALDVSAWDTSQVTNMSEMFQVARSLTELDVSGWDTSQVTDMSAMFHMAMNLTELDVSGWNTSHVIMMELMFSSANSLVKLDVSDWDTSQVVSMRSMLTNTISLRELILGEKFEFIVYEGFWWWASGNANLPEIQQTAEFTGYWQNVGNGTINNPLGTHVLTSAELMAQFNGATMADRFVWQPASESPIDTLRELIAEAEAKIHSNYTPRSWANMLSMLTFARTIYNNPTATDAQINNAIDLLRARLNELIELLK